MATQPNRTKSKVSILLRGVAFVILLITCSMKLWLSYRGLNQPEVMDQAQIARSVANGEGFKTLYHRPVELGDAFRNNESQPLDLSSFRDVNHAPLNIVSMAVALRATGAHDFADNRIAVSANGAVRDAMYGPDRVISATSCLYFLLAMVLAYILIARLFDEIVAVSTICCIAFCELMLDYAVSGLAQPMMMCFMFATLLMLLSAKRATDKEDSYVAGMYLLGSFVFMALMTLSGWMSAWVAIGYFVFCACYFRPYGLHGFIGFVVLLLSCSYSLWMNYQAVGNWFGNAYYGIYNCFGGSTEDVMRSVDSSGMGLNSSMVVLRFFGSVLDQLKSLYVNCGGIIVAPLFFLALFFRYKKSELQCMKWAICSMWALASVGMALYGTDTPLSSGQLSILFAPLFVAFGFSILFNFIARLNSKNITFAQLRGVSVLAVVLMTAGSQLAALPGDIYRGVTLRGQSSPNYPPYYPPALNCGLYDLTDDNELVMSDQPWAVAWYANRRAVWLPKTIADYQQLNTNILPVSGYAVQGIVVTPLSYDPMIPSAYAPTQHMKTGRPGGYTAVLQSAGEFAPLALNLPLAIMDPRQSMFVNNFAPQGGEESAASTRLGEIVTVSNTGSPAQFDYMNLLNAGTAAFYTKGKRTSRNTQP